MSDLSPSVPDTRRAQRAAQIRAAGACEGDVAPLLAYNRRIASLDALTECPFPLDDELFAEAWSTYVDGADHHGVFAELKKRLVQLQFPVRENISQTDAYRAAVRRGVQPESGEGLQLERPSALSIHLHDTPAGRLPVIVIPHRPDFVRFLQAIVHHNEPAPIPDSIGAMLVTGYNNWSRIAQIKKTWFEDNLLASESTWTRTFRRLKSEKHRYQDCFVLCSDGPYSGVPAHEMGLDAETWISTSRTLRIAHEATHYVTLRAFGSMETNATDELIADYFGIRAAEGRFRADWFERFMGLQSDQPARLDGRLRHYCSDDLSDAAYRVLQRLLQRAAHTLEAFDAGPGAAAEGANDARLVTLCVSTIDELADDDGLALLSRRYHQARSMENVMD